MCFVPQRYEFHNRGQGSDAHWVTGENQKHAEWKKAAMSMWLGSSFCKVQKKMDLERREVDWYLSGLGGMGRNRQCLLMTMELPFGAAEVF